MASLYWMVLLIGFAVPHLVVTDDSYHCYSCVYSYHPDVEQTCVYDPVNDIHGTNVSCGHGDYVCRSQRIWDKGENVIRSFYRGCEVRNQRTDNCVNDDHFIICESFCETELCNDDIPVPTPPAPGGAPAFSKPTVLTVASLLSIVYFIIA